MEQPGTILTEAIIQKIEAEAGKYPTRRAAVKSALRYAQAEFGWISEDVVKAVAEVLGLERIEVFEVATFYDMFELKPIGRHKIGLCTNISCQLRGVDAISKRFKERLGVDFGGTTDDGLFTLKEFECLGACTRAPMCLIDETYHVNFFVETMKTSKCNKIE